MLVRAWYCVHLAQATNQVAQVPQAGAARLIRLPAVALGVRWVSPDGRLLKELTEPTETELTGSGHRVQGRLGCRCSLSRPTWPMTRK